MPGRIKNVITAIDYIESHLYEKLDLETVAGAVHYSKYHLHRMFTGTVGLTIHDYVQRRKLTEAAKLLVLSDKPILEIAFIGSLIWTRNNTLNSYKNILKIGRH